MEHMGSHYCDVCNPWLIVFHGETYDPQVLHEARKHPSTRKQLVEAGKQTIVTTTSPTFQEMYKYMIYSTFGVIVKDSLRAIIFLVLATPKLFPECG
eukprot:3993148-Amphidinium_carterae.1